MTNEAHNSWATAAVVIVLLFALATCNAFESHEDNATERAKVQLQIAKLKAAHP